jgi:hypothetical protein
MITAVSVNDWELGGHVLKCSHAKGIWAKTLDISNIEILVHCFSFRPAAVIVSGRYRWTTVGPRPRRLKLCGEAEEGCLVTEAPDEVDTYWQVIGIPKERHRHGRLSGHVANRRKGQELSRTIEPLQWILRCGIESTEGHGRFA